MESRTRRRFNVAIATLTLGLTLLGVVSTGASLLH
ncbi:hypothetical protein ABH931_004542 [Streptacidiphilus sp. MAP12-33]